MTIFKEYHNYDGIGIAKLIKSKEVSIEDVLETAIDSLTKNNSKLKSIKEFKFVSPSNIVITHFIDRVKSDIKVRYK